MATEANFSLDRPGHSRFAWIKELLYRENVPWKKNFPNHDLKKQLVVPEISRKKENVKSQARLTTYRSFGV